MSASHGNTPAAWTAVGVAMLGVVIGSIALLLTPVSLVLLWVGILLCVVALPVFLVLGRLGFHDARH
jgi:uncharacterized membrane protein YfcA